MLSREGADARTLEIIYVAVVKEVLLYGLEMWVTTPRIGKILGGLNHRFSRMMAGQQIRIGRNGGWVYPP